MSIFSVKTLPETSLCELWRYFNSFFIHALLIVSCQIIINGTTAFLGNGSDLAFSQSHHCKFPQLSSELLRSAASLHYTGVICDRSALSGSRQLFQEGCLSGLDRHAKKIGSPLLQTFPSWQFLPNMVVWIICKCDIFVSNWEQHQICFNISKLHSSTGT